MKKAIQRPRLIKKEQINQGYWKIAFHQRQEISIAPYFPNDDRNPKEDEVKEVKEQEPPKVESKDDIIAALIARIGWLTENGGTQAQIDACHKALVKVVRRKDQFDIVESRSEIGALFAETSLMKNKKANAKIPKQGNHGFKRGERPYTGPGKQSSKAPKVAKKPRIIFEEKQSPADKLSKPKTPKQSYQPPSRRASDKENK